MPERKYKLIMHCAIMVTAFLYRQSVLLADTDGFETINLATAMQHPVQFKRIPANSHSLTNQTLTIKVNKSASFLLIPFEDIKQVTDVRFNETDSQTISPTGKNWLNNVLGLGLLERYLVII